MIEALKDLANQTYSDLIQGRISRSGYVRRLDMIHEKFPREIDGNFAQRRDDRTFGQFALDLYDEMLREKEISARWVNRFAKNHFGEVKVEYSGIESSGRLVWKGDFAKDEVKNPDLKLITSQGEIFLEIKWCPVLHKATYKVADLRHYASLDTPTYVMTMHTENAFYTLVDSAGLQRIVADIDASIIRTSIRHEMGNKPSVQFCNGLNRSGVSEFAVPLADYFQVLY